MPMNNVFRMIVSLLGCNLRGKDGARTWSVNPTKTYFSQSRGVAEEPQHRAFFSAASASLRDIGFGRAERYNPPRSYQMKLLPLLFLASSVLAIENDKPLLLRHPTISRTRIVFAFADDLWSVPREGGEAVRLTTGIGVEGDPIFSPDGSQIAFTGEYDGNVDVFVVPSGGGTPRRLTWHPAPDAVVGWTPDGK